MNNPRALDNLRPAFEPGNGVAVSHGAYARLRLSDAAGSTSDVLRELVPLKHDADEPTLQSFGFVIEQMRCAAKALENASENGRRSNALRLSQDARGWAHTALAYARELGMTPKARAELGLDLVRAGAMVERDLDLSRLSETQRIQLDRLLSIAEGEA